MWGFRECHIMPDLLLIYKKEQNILVLTCMV
ncbi:type II toxin-antitoxin system YafQ family toxin [uncultured Helicobacter sp.]